MASKSWPTTSRVQCPSSRRQLGRHTDPIVYAVGLCTSHLRKTSKRNSEESLQRSSKRSRTSQSPSEGTSKASSGPSSSAGPSDRTGENPSQALLVPVETRASRKRKSSSEESSEELKKRSRGTPSPTQDHAKTTGGSSEEEAGPSTQRRSGKRKSEETKEGPRKKSRNTPSPSAGPSNQTTTSNRPGPPSPVSPAPPHSTAAFQNKYEQEGLLGEGGFGQVYAGHRRDDNLPVAIKHIPQSDVPRVSIPLEGRIQKVPMEVALLLRLKPAEAGTSGVVALLDWYDLDEKLILVLERPVPCMDLFDYMGTREQFLVQEHQAKIITKQLVDTLIEVHSKGVFHRDIKLDNILIETGSDVPRARLIDFGCGTFIVGLRYFRQLGTLDYCCPEFLLHGWYKPESTTVWQLGVTVFGMLHGHFPFASMFEISHADPDPGLGLTVDCQDFLLSCLVKDPDCRPTLQTLRNHPWLM